MTVLFEKYPYLFSRRTFPPGLGYYVEVVRNTGAQQEQRAFARYFVAGNEKRSDCGQSPTPAQGHDHQLPLTQVLPPGQEPVGRLENFRGAALRPQAGPIRPKRLQSVGCPDLLDLDGIEQIFTTGE